MFVEFNNEEALEKAFAENEISSVIIEGIQESVGFRSLQILSFRKRKLCQEHNAVFILDEIQSGYGRTGKFFAHQFSGVKPDIITTAKGMGNGFPVAGVLISPKIEAKKGMLGTTFGGNYLACAASLAVLQILEQENLIQNAQEMGDYLVEQVKDLPKVKEVRSVGLMTGIELEMPCAEVQ